MVFVEKGFIAANSKIGILTIGYLCIGILTPIANSVDPDQTDPIGAV